MKRRSSRNHGQLVREPVGHARITDRCPDSSCIRCHVGRTLPLESSPSSTRSGSPTAYHNCAVCPKFPGLRRTASVYDNEDGEAIDEEHLCPLQPEISSRTHHSGPRLVSSALHSIRILRCALSAVSIMTCGVVLRLLDFRGSSPRQFHRVFPRVKRRDSSIAVDRRAASKGASKDRRSLQ